MTRFINSSLIGSAIFCFSFALSAATLNVSDNLIVSEIDDKSVEHGFIGKKSAFKLSQGSHALVVRYKDVFEDLDFAEDRVVESREFVVKFTVTGEEQLKLATGKISNLASAELFAKSPKLVLKDEHNNQVMIDLEKVSDYKLAKQVNIAVNTLAAKQVIDKVNEPVLSAVALIKEPVSKVMMTTNQADNTLMQVKSLVMLKYWWQNASNDEKQHFKQFIIKNK